MQENPETIQEYAFIVAYLEFLIQEWEAWGETAKQAIKEQPSLKGRARYASSLARFFLSYSEKQNNSKDYKGMAELKNIRIAVSGIYDYALEEIPSLRLPMPGHGAPDWVEEKRIYKVYRPAETLRRACDKFKMLPLTHHHPQSPVNEQNFRDLTIGYTGENPFIDYIKDKDEVGIRSNVMLCDQEAMDSYNRGEIQLSPGYVADFEWKKGTDPHGNEYDIVMKEITDVNHLALLPAGRGGSYAVVLDEAPKKDTIFERVQGTVFDRYRK